MSSPQESPASSASEWPPRVWIEPSTVDPPSQGTSGCTAWNQLRDHRAKVEIEYLSLQEATALIEEARKDGDKYVHRDEHERILEKLGVAQRGRTAAQAEVERLKIALGIAANQLDAVSLGIATHKQNIGVVWWVSTYAEFAAKARAALAPQENGKKESGNG